MEFKSGETDLTRLMMKLDPVLAPGEFVFLTFPQARYGSHAHLEPIAAFVEPEGLTLIVPRKSADDHGHQAFEAAFRMISLGAFSSLEAVGLTAAVANRLASAGISANVVAAFFHDHVFVPSQRAVEALDVLKQLGNR